MNNYFDLLKIWCDRLIELQLGEKHEKYFRGAILCPSCALIHGRLADSVYPFTLMYDKTGDKKYYDAAKLAMQWADNNVLRTRGRYNNDKINNWCGTSVFFAAAIGKALLYHGKCLDKETYEEWYGKFLEIVDFCNCYMKKARPHINYFAAHGALLALAHKITGEDSYKTEAYSFMEFVKNQFDKGTLLTGEGPIGKVTAKGCGYIDIGYNVEESLPSIAEFAHFCGDKVYTDLAIKAFKAHLNFMLPDGAWDDSFGTRANKWTYWGSRTSDGAQAGLCLISEYDDVLAEAAQRNFELYEKCTHDGLLYGGKMYIEYGEEPCVHHTFCHAKALCAMIDSGFEPRTRVLLPRETQKGVKGFNNDHVLLISKGDFRVTATDADTCNYRGAAVSGGTLSLVWHNKTGVVFSAATAEFYPSEPTNMQFSKNDLSMPDSALRIVNSSFQSVNDLDAKMTFTETDEYIGVTACGILKNADFEGNIGYTLDYRIYDDRITVTASAKEKSRIYLPIVCGKAEKCELSGNEFTAFRKTAKIMICADTVLCIDGGTSRRNFHVIGGFGTVPVYAVLEPGKIQTFEIKIL